MNHRQQVVAEELKPLLDLCYAGKLYEIEEWIRAGQPFDGPADARSSPLLIALKRGFYSMVELLLKNGARPTDKALLEAVRSRRLDMVTLLLDHGADVNSIHLSWVFDCGNSQIMRLFMDRGADPTKDDVLADSLCCHAIKPLVGIYKSYHEKIPGLQRQIDIALCHHCREGHIGSVCLLLWAGANPRAKVPELGRNEEWTSTALEEAVLWSRMDIVEKIGIDPKKDDLNDLLGSAITAHDPELVRKILSLGADVNRVSEEGNTPLRHAFWPLEWSSILGGDSDTDQKLECIKILVEAGAKWSPSKPRDVSDLRKAFYNMKPRHVVDTIKLLKQHGAISDEVLVQILNTPKMKEQLNWEMGQVGKILQFFAFQRLRGKASRRT